MTTPIYLNAAENLQFAALAEGAQILNTVLMAAGQQPAVLVSKNNELCSPTDIYELIRATKQSLSVALRGECIPTKVKKSVKDGVETVEEIHEPKLPRDLIEAFMDSQLWEGLPRIKQTARAPIIRPDFTVRWEPGWDDQTQCWVLPGLAEDRRLVGFVWPKKEGDPRSEEPFKITDIFEQFPFVDKRLVADCVAMCLTPLLSTAIDGALPAMLVTARKPGSGKSELVKFCSLCGNGGKAFTTWRSNDEMQKLVATFSSEDKRVVIFDNIKRDIDSPDLESAITSRYATFREMRTHSSIETRCNTTWMFTANGASMSQDMLRRSVIVLLDKDSHPAGWDGKWVSFVEREEAALVTFMCHMIDLWKLAGCPKGKLRYPGFEQWSEIVSGILEVNGIEGLFEARDLVEESGISTDEDDVGEIINCIAMVMAGTASWSAKDLWDATQDMEAWGDGPDSKARRYLRNWIESNTRKGGAVGTGMLLGKHKDKIFKGCEVKITNKRTKEGTKWVVENIGGSDKTEDVVEVAEKSPDEWM